MKRMLCSLVLLIAMSATGLLVGSKSASAFIMVTDRWEELQNYKWKGWWDPTGGTGGRAELSLERWGDTTVHAEFSIYGSLRGDFTFWAEGKVYGNAMELKSGGA